jgi:PadR family transcriptional regulator PadR
MGKQATEMLKGVLEGIVLAILATQAAYGYEITARLRDEGFTDIAEGTVYAQGREQLDEFWGTWSFLTTRLEQLRTASTETEGN